MADEVYGQYGDFRLVKISPVSIRLEHLELDPGSGKQYWKRWNTVNVRNINDLFDMVAQATGEERGQLPALFKSSQRMSTLAFPSSYLRYGGEGPTGRSGILAFLSDVKNRTVNPKLPG